MAIAILCCSPPESWFKRLAFLCDIPTISSSFNACSFLFFSAPNCIGVITFSRALRYGRRLRALFCQTNPTVSRLYSTSCFSVIVNKFFPSTNNLPALGVSNPPSIFKNVDLPEPLLPIIASNSPRSTCKSSPCRAKTSSSAVL